MPSSSLNNDRIFSACIAVLYKERQTTKTGGGDPPSGGTLLAGVQSVGVNGVLNRSSYYDMGRFQRNVGSYGKQEFEITISRVLDANDPSGRGKMFYNPTAISDYKSSHMMELGNIGADGFSDNLRNYDITIVYAEDDKRYVGHGSDFNAITYRCCLLKEISYSIPISGPVTEDITLSTGVVTKGGSGFTFDYPHTRNSPGAQGLPDSRSEAMVLKRQDIDINNSVLPVEVERAFDMGGMKDGIPYWGLQSIEIGASIEYVDLFDNGEFGGANFGIAGQNLMKQVSFPVAVTASFTGITRDQYMGSDLGLTGTGSQWKLTDQNFGKEDGSESGQWSKYETEREINIKASPGHANSGWPGTAPSFYQWILGTRNYLTDISVSGGDAPTGNVETTLSYQNEFSDFATWQQSAPKNYEATPSTGDIY